VEAEIARAPRGKVTVIEFVDYQCPFCRRMEDELAPFIAEHREQIHLVRKHVPLRSHRRAKPMARLSICAEEQNAGEAMHQALMTTDDISPEGLRGLAQQVGVDEAKLEACARAPSVDERIADDVQTYVQAGGEGVPMVFIGRRKFVGLTPIEALEEAFREALGEVD
jgi:protein-disulfide isomerase